MLPCSVPNRAPLPSITENIERCVNTKRPHFKHPHSQSLTNEPESVVVCQQRGEGLGVKFVVAEVQRGVDGLEGLKVDVDFLLLALVRDDRAAVDDQSVRGHLGVELEAVLHGGDGAQHGQPVHSTFDVGGSAVLIGQHLADATDLERC